MLDILSYLLGCVATILIVLGFLDRYVIPEGIPISRLVDNLIVLLFGAAIILATSIILTRLYEVTLG